MKLIKYVSILALVGVLVGCGGHGYEGEWEQRVLGDLRGKVVIGSDYTQSEGERQEFEIFVRESDKVKYLVFKDKESEEAWEILDQDTLRRGPLNLVRVK